MNTAIVGIGFMGWIHWLAYQKVSGVNVTAVCSRDEKKRAGDWRGIQGNFGPPGEQVDLSDVAAYESLEQVLADPNVDLVDLCLPPQMHEQATVAALRAGKHVLCEKPIALKSDQAQRMVQAAEGSGKQLLIGHVLPFFAEFEFALQAVRDGRYGKLLGGRFKRVISDPSWLPDFYDPERIGGPLVDLHIHDAHFIRLLCGMPRAVFSQGRMRGAVPEFVETQFIFEEPLTVSAASGVINQQSRAFTHAFEIHLQRATLAFDFAVIDGAAVTTLPLTVFPAEGDSQQPELSSPDPIDGFAREIEEVHRSITASAASPILDGGLALDALVLCERQQQSMQEGTIIDV